MLKILYYILVYSIFTNISVADSYITYSNQKRQEINQSACDQAFNQIAIFMRRSSSEVETFDVNDPGKKKNLQALLNVLEASGHKMESCLVQYKQHEEIIISALSDISIVLINLRGWKGANSYLIPSRDRMLDNYQNCLVKISEIEISH